MTEHCLALLDGPSPWLRLREKNGEVNEMPCDHKLEAYLNSYIAAVGIEGDRKGPLFRATLERTGNLSEQGHGSRGCLIHRAPPRGRRGNRESIGCHTFRADGITDNLTKGGKLEIAERMAGHSNPKTIGLYDRRNDDISVSEVERVGI